jgi:hypothetical protein
MERDDPALWPEFLGVVREFRARGLTRSSARQVMDVLRWQRGHGMPNEYGPLLGRLLRERHPGLADFLDIRPCGLDAPGDDRQADLFGAPA